MRQFFGATNIAVNIAASSAIDDDGKDEVKADEYESSGETGAVWIQASPILKEGVPKLTKAPSVKNSKKLEEEN